MKALLLENVHTLGRETLEKAGVEVDDPQGRAGRGRADRRARRRRHPRHPLEDPGDVPGPRRRAVARRDRRLLHRDQPDRPAARGRTRRRGLQRAVLQHPVGRRARARRDHLADAAADGEGQVAARRRLGQVGHRGARGAWPHAGDRRVRQHRHPALGGRRGPGAASRLLRHRREARAGQRGADDLARRPARRRRHRHAARGRPAGQRGDVRGRAVRADEARSDLPQPLPRVPRGLRDAARAGAVRARVAAPPSTSSRRSPRWSATPFTSELRDLPNVILTPHIGGSTEEAQQDIGLFVVGQAARLPRRWGRPTSRSTCRR